MLWRGHCVSMWGIAEAEFESELMEKEGRRERIVLERVIDERKLNDREGHIRERAKKKEGSVFLCNSFAAQFIFM